MQNRWFVSTVVIAIELFAVVRGPAQGTTTYLSGLNSPAAGTLAVGKYAWVATWFMTGDWPAGYTLNSIQLSMGQPSGSPTDFTVMILDYLFKPLSVLSGPDPSTENVFAYSGSGFMLARSTGYYVAVTSATPVSVGSFQWNYTTANPIRIGYWNGQNGYMRSATGSNWGDRYVGATPQFAVNATPIPEPSVLALLVVGCGLLWATRRRWPGTTQTAP